MTEIERLIDRLEHHYRFECEAGPLQNCVDWQQLIRLVRAERTEQEQDALDPRDIKLAVALEALREIDDASDACQCDHRDENCCARVPGVFCERCIAGVALHKLAEQEQDAARMQRGDQP